MDDACVLYTEEFFENVCLWSGSRLTKNFIFIIWSNLVFLIQRLVLLLVGSESLWEIVERVDSSAKDHFTLEH